MGSQNWSDRCDNLRREYTGSHPGSGPYLKDSVFPGIEAAQNARCAVGKSRQNSAPRRAVALPSEFGHAEPVRNAQ